MIPMLVKEWRRLLRASSTPWVLGLYILVPAVVAALYLKTAHRGPAGLMPQMLPMMGAQALSNVAAWQILFLAVWSPWLTAGMLIAELEERTLDPFLAGGGHLLGAVAGKLAAVLSFFAMAILAGLPAFALPMLVGGINWTLMARVAALEGATAVLMAGLGLLLSSLGRRTGSVAMAGVALGLALTLGTGLVAQATGVTFEYFDPRASVIRGPASTRAFPGPRWLYTNPLVGLNSALDNGAPALLQIPGNWTRTVYKEYRIWQVQIAGGAAVGAVSLVLAWLAMLVRLRWRRPRLRWGRRKAVAVDG